MQESALGSVFIFRGRNTIDHRRLAAFRMAKLDSVPFRWATDEEVANQMWKMTTKTNGISIKLKLADGQSMTIQ